jgi:NAD(P)H-quinone oxidoreductase subunit H
MKIVTENRTNLMFVPYVSRWDYAAGMFNEAVTVNAVERLANIAIPKRASYIRILMLELNRIANHLLWLGPFMLDLGAGTPLFYIFVLYISRTRADLRSVGSSNGLPDGE